MAAYLVVREEFSTVYCAVLEEEGFVSPQMVQFSKSLSPESVVDVEGIVHAPTLLLTNPLIVEVVVRKLYCVNKADPALPFNIKDASRSEAEIDLSIQARHNFLSWNKNKKNVWARPPFERVNQDTRLNYRFLDLRTPANLAIFRVKHHLVRIFRQLMSAEGFFEIWTPKKIAGSSEGSADVFRFDYKGTPACLAQSPQLYKQMSVCGGAFPCVFEIGPVFRADDLSTHQHLCEYIGVEAEMQIKDHYSEIMDILGRVFVEMFDNLRFECAKEFEAINKQYPFEHLKYFTKTLQLTYEEGVQMLKEEGIESDPFGDLNTEMKRKLGQLVREKYCIDFFILHRYPLAYRPFYTMPCHGDQKYSNSFDVIIRGEDIISGAQVFKGAYKSM